MKKFLNYIFIAALSVSSHSFAGVLEINFNGNEFLLGTFESAETGTQFYSYGSPSGSSANPVYPGTTDLIPLMADALQIFSHINTNTNELSFGVILEKPNGSGGGTFATSIAWSEPALLSFVDDPNESGTLNAGGPQDISLAWIDCCTDGFIISGFDPEDLFIDLTQVTGSDLTQVIFLSPDRQDHSFEFPQEEFNISITSCDPQTNPAGCVIETPEPSTLAIFALGLLGLAWRQVRKR